MRKDTLHLFEKTNISNIDYFDMNAEGLADAAMERWSLIRQVYATMSNGSNTLPSRMSTQIADFFTSEANLENA